MPEGKYLASVKLGPKGQIVVPKEVREDVPASARDTAAAAGGREPGGLHSRPLKRRNPVFRDVFSDREQ